MDGEPKPGKLPAGCQQVELEVAARQYADASNRLRAGGAALDAGLLVNDALCRYSRVKPASANPVLPSSARSCVSQYVKELATEHGDVRKEIVETHEREP